MYHAIVRRNVEKLFDALGRADLDYATLADGTPYVNDGAHVIRLHWGKVIVLHAYLDTQIVVDAMRVMTKAGVAEASAAKIED